MLILFLLKLAEKCQNLQNGALKDINHELQLCNPLNAFKCNLTELKTKSALSA